MAHDMALWRKLAAVAAFAALLVGQVFVLPTCAFMGFGGVGIKDEKQMGRKFEVMVRSRLPLVEDPEVSLYVRDLVARLAGGIPPQPFTFSSGVILHNAMNAFAVPGGHVFVFTGLIMQFDNEAELAGVLAHEMAHVTQRHVAARIERGAYLSLASLLLAVAGIAVGGSGGGALAMGAMGAGQSAMLNYSRIDENEADHIGYQYLLMAGYNPQGMVTGFQKIRQKSFMSGSSVPAYLSTHPDITDRITGIRARLEATPAGLVRRAIDNRRFLRVKTLLWGRYGDVQAAEQLFRKSAATDALSCLGLAMVEARANRVQQAAASFDRALQLAPRDALVLREAGIFHYRKGDTARAERLLTAALEVDRRDYMARFFYARLLDDTGRGQEAQSHFAEVQRALPEDSEVHAAWARSLGNQGKTFDAWLHMAYSSLYGNDKKRTAQYADKARGLAATPEQRARMQRFDARYKERRDVWKERL